jgi:flagellar secretion chaperone FliS
MNTKARDAYLEAQILTATPQKLRLMLIDAALRQARTAQAAILEERLEDAYEAGSRCRRVITELISSIRPDNSELVTRVTTLYVYLFQTVTEAQLRRDGNKYDDVIKVLEMEQETWRQVCEKLPEAPRENSAAPCEITAGSLPAIPSTICSVPRPHSEGGFSLDA